MSDTHEARLDPGDPVGCGCDEFPECTHALYFYMGAKHASRLSSAALASPAQETAPAAFNARAFAEKLFGDKDIRDCEIALANAAYAAGQAAPTTAQVTPEMVLTLDDGFNKPWNHLSSPLQRAQAKAQFLNALLRQAAPASAEGGATMRDRDITLRDMHKAGDAPSGQQGTSAEQLAEQLVACMEFQGIHEEAAGEIAYQSKCTVATLRLSKRGIALVATHGLRQRLEEHDHYCKYCRHKRDYLGGKGRCMRGADLERQLALLDVTR